MRSFKNLYSVDMSKNIVIVILSILLFLAIGIGIGYRLNNDTNEDINPNQSNSENTEAKASNGISKVNDYVAYQVPGGWEQKICDRDTDSVYFATSNFRQVDCSSAPESQIKLSLSSENYTECNQIPEKQDVKKHICISKYINDLRSLHAETEYLPSSSFGKETSMKTYYIDSGQGMIKAEYIYSANGSDQTGFESLVDSIKAK